MPAMALHDGMSIQNLPTTKICDSTNTFGIYFTHKGEGKVIFNGKRYHIDKLVKRLRKIHTKIENDIKTQRKTFLINEKCILNHLKTNFIKICIESETIFEKKENLKIDIR